MKLPKVGAMRSATSGARLSAANSLVQRTLAQHGLADQSSPAEKPAMPALDNILANFSPSQSWSGASRAAVPNGATFKDSTFTCEAGSRRFCTYVPAKAAAGAAGVLVMLHGCTQTPEDFAVGTGMNTFADAHGFVVVYPAQSRVDNAQSCWNWFNRGDQRRGSGEPALLAALTRQVCTEHGIGQERTFVAGLSAGAAMAVILGDTYPDVYAAVGAHSGLPLGSAKDVSSAFAAMAGNGLEAPDVATTTDPVRTIVFHGTADNTVHQLNGDSIARRARDSYACQSIETTISGKAGGRTYTRAVSSDLNGTALVEHFIIQGQGHAWSGGQPAGSYTDPKGPDASAEMIRFFFEIPSKTS
ncbi:PHB depolymerase family esterase [Rhodobacteraceae bacterium]|nr:PHB depolymerase family esterase [Paracoccaceae bacterium]